MPVHPALRLMAGCCILLMLGGLVACLWPDERLLRAMTLPPGLLGGLVLLIILWLGGRERGPAADAWPDLAAYISEAALRTDAHLRLLAANPAAERLLGGPLALQRPLHRLLRVECDEGSFEQILHAVLACTTGATAAGNARLLLAEEVRRVRYRIHRLVEGEHPCLLLLLEDTTEQHAMNVQLHQASKLEAIGRLTGGIAHDFNNMLAAVTGAAEMIQSAGEDPAERSHHVGIILSTAGQAAELTGKLLAYARKQPDQRQCLDCRQLLDNTCDLLQHSVDHGIRVLCDKATDPCLIKGHASALINALLNLGLNARDAMPDGGTLTLACHPARLDSTQLQAFNPQPAPGRYVLISVTDTGTGIPPEAQSAIFDPFFTTKGPTGGTGLGLAAVAGTVRSHDGGIAVRSLPDQGSTFTIALPLLEEELESRDRPVSTATLTAWKGRGTVLLVDDDQHVRSVGCAQLRSLGLTVHAAASGEEALQRYRDAGPEIDVVLLDLIMPDCDGAQVFADLRTWDPDLPIVLASGHAGGIDVDRMLADGAIGFLQKPYRRMDLIRMLRRVLPEAD